MKKLPIGIQTFSEIITEDYLYVDKTKEITELLQGGKYLFLSRPRRFGKSLLISTLAEIFSGNQQLFQGLYIYDQIDWQSYPVIIIDFNKISYTNDEVFKTSLLSFLDKAAAKYDIKLSDIFIKDKFGELIEKISEKTQKKVVILIDEYDKPIVEHIDDIEKAIKNREIVRDFFGILKSSDPFLRFVFLTGVSKFSRVSIFSELNNVRDITFSRQFATLCGYTQIELETNFESYIQNLGTVLEIKKPVLLTKIKTWYNGYSWNAKDKMYNPFSILNLFMDQRFSNYWFATGTPTFLMKLIKKTELDTTEFENKKVSEILFDSYNLENLNIFALLFQTGYLTISEINQKSRTIQYILNYPNFEVKQAFMTFLFSNFTKNDLGDIQPAAEDLLDCLENDDIEGFINIIRALFAKIPYNLHIKKEAYYHSLFYMVAVLMGVEIDLEILTDKGRIDGVLEFENKIYLIEFKYAEKGTKMDNLTNKAIAQIKDKNYGERFLNNLRKRVYLGVGVLGKEIGYKIEKA
ncbi:ATP-binding protein [Candidatus Marithrix sp. Canyon 246]|uniref:ATP-binding protein n=1 Tax=Candidatus Marithrix sp. Canyon 246 TaxID=1827136 RepID=UPI00084A1E85|nr:ATP-binding protein [Candidatus Marithrix sp. Canyon 246]